MAINQVNVGVVTPSPLRPPPPRLQFIPVCSIIPGPDMARGKIPQSTVHTDNK